MVKTFDQLISVEPIELGSGWTVRLGLSDGGEDGGPWMLLYCLADYDPKKESELIGGIPVGNVIYGEILGPVFYNVKAPDKGITESKDVNVIQALYGRGLERVLKEKMLFISTFPVSQTGEYILEMFSDDGTPILRKTMLVQNPRPAYWVKFISHGIKARIANMAHVRHIEGVYPCFDGKKYIDGGKLKKAIRQNILPGEITPSGNRINGKHKFPLKLSISNGYFVIQREKGSTFFGIEDRILARWWVNDKPVTVDSKSIVRHKEIHVLITPHTQIKVKLGVPNSLSKLKIGDSIGLQVLYSPSGSRLLSSQWRYDENAQVGRINWDSHNEPLLSNRLDFLADAHLLAALQGDI